VRRSVLIEAAPYVDARRDLRQHHVRPFAAH
jgi:hypothetical protein